MPTSLTYQTGVACAQAPHEYFVSDYQANSGGDDLYRVSPNGSKAVASSERGAYGGYPLTMYGDETLVRGELSSTYSWARMEQLRFASRARLDAITRTVTTDVPSGIGDLCYDGRRLHALSYDSALVGRRLDSAAGGGGSAGARRRLGTAFTISGLHESTYQVDPDQTVTGDCPSATVPAALDIPGHHSRCSCARLRCACQAAKQGGSGSPTE